VTMGFHWSKMALAHFRDVANRMRSHINGRIPWLHTERLEPAALGEKPAGWADSE
jgi:hypothetical protein